nr:uncharacterized protein LOC100333235 isoform X2 [Danio rerio]|eukprot:XP_009290133.1 uncharacterized protein LOC100333235 isoform X2 [Danio rerio]
MLNTYFIHIFSFCCQRLMEENNPIFTHRCNLRTWSLLFIEKNRPVKEKSTYKVNTFIYGIAKRLFTMRILCLLAFLCLPSFILCGFRNMTIYCPLDETENGNQPSKWNISLAKCDTLQITCTDRNNQKICKSLEECGRNQLIEGFIDKLLGYINCERKEKGIKCDLHIACNHTIYLELDHLLTDDKKTGNCKFRHNVLQCIQYKENLQNLTDCNMTVASNTAEKRSQEGKNNSTEDTADCKLETYILGGVILCLIGVVFLIALVIRIIMKMRTASGSANFTHSENTPFLRTA